MPFRSEAQRRKFLSLYSQGKISRTTLMEWTQATGQKKLPERSPRKK